MSSTSRGASSVVLERMCAPVHPSPVLRVMASCCANSFTVISAIDGAGNRNTTNSTPKYSIAGMGFLRVLGYVMDKARRAAGIRPVSPGGQPTRGAGEHRSIMSKAISAVRNWFRPSPMGRDHAPALMPVLLASGRDDDYQTLKAFLHDTKWSVVQALSSDELSSFCECTVNPVVLVDRHFQGSDWQSTVASIRDPASSRCVILLSDVSDPYLWNGLVHQGGFDILTRPFERREVLRILAFAQRHRTADWPPLHLPH